MAKPAATPKQATISEILDSEHNMVLTASKTYGAYYDHALQSSVYFTHFVSSIPKERIIFANFLSQAKKHLTLSLFSTVRLHGIQAKLTLRYALESGANAAFALANPDPAGFVVEADGALDVSQRLTKKAYEWLDKYYSAGSKQIKEIKHLINQTMAHPSLMNTHHPIIPAPGQSHFHAPFFDEDDSYHVETSLWLIGRATIILMDLIWGINQHHNFVGFDDDFLKNFQKFQNENEKLHAEKTSSDRHRAAMAVESPRNKTTGGK